MKSCDRRRCLFIAQMRTLLAVSMTVDERRGPNCRSETKEEQAMARLGQPDLVDKSTNLDVCRGPIALFDVLKQASDSGVVQPDD